MGGKLQIARSRNSETLKPVAPEDLWAKLDAALARAKVKTCIQKPMNTMTRQEIQEHYGWTVTQTQNRIRKMIEAKEIKAVGTGDRGVVFYAFTEQ